MLAGSEPDKSFQQFAMANHTFENFYDNLSDQLLARQCSVHHSCCGQRCHVPEEPDLLIMGTPCNPFSLQRVKRFKGTVFSHQLADHAFKDSYCMLEKFRPAHAILEQTDGFQKPIEEGHAETPLEKLLACTMGEAVLCTCVEMKRRTLYINVCFFILSFG